MTIEVKQMIIKSAVVNEPKQQEHNLQSIANIEQIKELVMEECKMLITESLNELQER